MKCTNCGLINPENAERCDCGYDFATQTIKASYLPVQLKSSRGRWTVLLISPAIFIVIGPPVGYFSSFLVQPIVMEGIRSVTTLRDLGMLVGWLPLAYWLGAVPALCTGIAYGMISLVLPHKILRNFLWRALLGGVLGTVSTKIFCHFTELNTDIALWAGLPAGAICSLLPQNWPLTPLRNRSRNNRVAD